MATATMRASFGSLSGGRSTMALPQDARAPARALGMTTVWLKTGSPCGKHGPLLDVAPGDIDHETDNLTQFLNSIRISA